MEEKVSFISILLKTEPTIDDTRTMDKLRGFSTLHEKTMEICAVG